MTHEQLSPDGRWRWDGAQWVANDPAPAPPSYPSPPPVNASTFDAGPTPPWTPPPLASQGTRVAARPPAAAWQTAPPRAAVPARSGLAFQFSGDAMWSIIFGVAAIAVPLFTPIYFPILPIFGLWRGIRALGQGRTAGGVAGLIVSGIGCLFSLLASGLLSSLLH
ncbi:MAG: hypothetical protein E6J41_07245 [Chloroflexi bacterium]|nr:MAG: hypothetical protein E6J41_07245 [Chloroflexota bacterium]